MPSKSQFPAAAPEQIEALPVDERLERETLGNILIHGRIPASLGRDAFYLHDHKRVFDCVDNLLAAGKAANYLTVHHALGRDILGDRDALDYLMDLSKDGLPGDVEQAVEILNELALRRKVITFTDVVNKSAKLGHRLTTEIIVDAATKFREMAEHAAPAHTAPSTTPLWPDPLQPEAFHGIAGELVKLIEPHTEADVAALLVQFLVAWGSLTGRGPYYLAEADRHHTNLYAVVNGVTSKGRKGTSWSRMLAVLETVDEGWTKECLLAGLGSGEALCDSLNHDDHRRLVIESEFARLLAIMQREGATISAIFRQCWDHGRADVTIRGKEVHATGAHLSMIAHVTKDELVRRLADTELANGFANRILFACAKRSKELPHGGGLINFGDIPERLQAATAHARRMGNTRMRFDHDARLLWEAVYHDLSEGRPGLAGAVTSRAEAQTVRLSLVYALLDSADEIRVEHLRAALAVWKYCEQSAAYIWGSSLGDPVADSALTAIRASKEGLTGWQLSAHFNRNKPAAEIERAVAVLVERGLVRVAKEESGGRPTVRYVAA